MSDETRLEHLLALAGDEAVNPNERLNTLRAIGTLIFERWNAGRESTKSLDDLFALAAAEKRQHWEERSAAKDWTSSKEEPALRALGEHLLRTDRISCLKLIVNTRLVTWEQENAARRAAQQDELRRQAEQVKRAAATTAKPWQISPRVWGAISMKPVKVGETVLIQSRKNGEWFGDVTELITLAPPGRATTFKYNNKRKQAW